MKNILALIEKETTKRTKSLKKAGSILDKIRDIPSNKVTLKQKELFVEVSNQYEEIAKELGALHRAKRELDFFE